MQLILKVSSKTIIEINHNR